ncbi:unnamed protein product [Pelagomonas calceolata]|uniref:Uncharacterized protein n=1 Tax=Pelagomonas calceolata TaxID=35677 RepID=A0A7S3ZK87_9STRA|nr:unnamed protein product [Pelagomonas calceolata]
MESDSIAAIGAPGNVRSKIVDTPSVAAEAQVYNGDDPPVNGFEPTIAPTAAPSLSPTLGPTSSPPTPQPTGPSPSPTAMPVPAPTPSPSRTPSAAPSAVPTIPAPSSLPTTAAPTIPPTSAIPTLPPTLPSCPQLGVPDEAECAAVAGELPLCSEVNLAPMELCTANSTICPGVPESDCLLRSLYLGLQGVRVWPGLGRHPLPAHISGKYSLVS